MSPLDTYPLWKQALLTGDRWTKPYSEQRLATLNAALTQWQEAQLEGSILNVRFVESKETISRALENAWSALPRDEAWRRAQVDGAVDAVETAPSPNLATLAGRAKRVMKATPHPDRDRLLAFIEEMGPVIQQYEFLKKNTLKRRVLSAEERAEQEANAFVPPPPSTQAVATVQALLEATVDRHYAVLEAGYKHHLRTVVENFVKAEQEADAQPKRYASWVYTPYDHLKARRGRGDPAGLAFLSKVLVTDPTSGRYGADASTWQASDAEAVKQAQDVRNKFVFKNLQKLAPLLEAKGDALFESARELGDSVRMQQLEGDFAFSFKDGSSFEIHNSIVFVVNQYDTRFYRFPLTFRSVLLPGGVPMPQPSEQRMHEVFAVATPAETSPSPAPRRGRHP